MVVIFALVPDGRDNHVVVIDDLEECDVTGVAKRNDQLPQKWTVGCLSAREWRPTQTGEPIADGVEGPLRDFEITIVPMQFALQDKVEQALKIICSLARQSNSVGHFASGVAAPGRLALA